MTILQTIVAGAAQAAPAADPAPKPTNGVDKVTGALSSTALDFSWVDKVPWLFPTLGFVVAVLLFAALVKAGVIGAVKLAFAGSSVDRTREARQTLVNGATGSFLLLVIMSLIGVVIGFGVNLIFS